MPWTRRARIGPEVDCRAVLRYDRLQQHGYEEGDERRHVAHEGASLASTHGVAV